MNKSTDTNPVVSLAVEPETEVVEKKPNALVRGFRKIKQNPRVVIAVAGGAALVAAGAALGRSTTPSTTIVYAEIENDDVEVPEDLDIASVES